MKRIYRFDTETQYSNTVVNLPSVSFTDDSTSNFYNMSEPYLRIVFDKGNDKIIYFSNGICDLDLTSSGVYNNGTSGSNPLKLYFNRVKKIKGGIYYDGIKEVYIDRYLEKINYQDTDNETWCNATDIIYVSPDNQHYISNENSCIVERSTNKLIGGTKNVIIPNYVTTIGYGAFIDIDFDEFIIPNSVIMIEEDAFSGCNCESIRIGSGLLNVEGATNYQFIFNNTDAKITIDTFQHFCQLNLEYVSNSPYTLVITENDSTWMPVVILGSSTTPLIDKRFGKNLSIKILLIIGEVPAMAFQYCTNLETLHLQASTIIGNFAFQNCTSLTTINAQVSSGTTTLEELGSGVFKGCTALTNVDLSSTTSLTTIKGQFYGPFAQCTSLVELKLPSSIISIGNRFVQGCTSLQRVILYATTPPTITTNTWTDSNNCLIYVPDTSVNTYKAAQYWSAIADRIKPISELT